MRNKKGQFVNGEIGKEYRFTSENTKGNQHAKGNPPNKTSFDGSKNQEKHPHWKGGLQKTEDGYYRSYASGKRMPNGRYVWQQVYGQIPIGYIIWHIDRNKYNDDIENLEAISRAESVRRNSK